MVTGKGLQKENALAAPAVKNQQEYARCRECISSGRGPLGMTPSLLSAGELRPRFDRRSTDTS